MPAGRANWNVVVTNSLMRHGPVLGASARNSAGMPMVRVESSVRWRGRNG